MRSAHETTSPSGVAGGGRLHEWFRTPSSVSAQRFSDSRTTSAPHPAWSYPPATYGLRASSLAGAQPPVPAAPPRAPSPPPPPPAVPPPSSCFRPPFSPAPRPRPPAAGGGGGAPPLNAGGPLSPPPPRRIRLHRAARRPTRAGG